MVLKARPAAVTFGYVTSCVHELGNAGQRITIHRSDVYGITVTDIAEVSYV